MSDLVEAVPSAPGTGVPVQVRPGLWAVSLPLPGPPHRVTVYVLETEAGPYLVDAGWDTDQAWQALGEGLAGLGTRVEEIQGVLVTHAHLDHYGLAPRIREASGAWVALHPLDAEELPGYRVDPAERLVELLRGAGAPDSAIESAAAELGRASGHQLAGPDVLLGDGRRPDVPGWDLTTVWTPGHTPGHLCFWEPRHRLLLAGDHALPRTAVIMHEPRGPQDDPLGDYLGSLDRLEQLRPDEVLPAHEHRYTDLSGRLDRLRGYHADRLAATVALLGEGPATAWELAGRQRARGSLDGLRGYPLHATVTRTLAQLAHLRTRGLAEERPGPPPHWALTAAARIRPQPGERCPAVGG